MTPKTGAGTSESLKILRRKLRRIFNP